MSNIPPDHAELLARDHYDIACPAGRFLSLELYILCRYGYWLDALASRRIHTQNEQQDHFVRAASGEVEPQTIYEFLWLKMLRTRIAWIIEQQELAQREQSATVAARQRLERDREQKLRVERLLAARRPFDRDFNENFGIPDWDFT
jgi:uncharacterized protein YifE (UPF0438 family)